MTDPHIFDQYAARYADVVNAAIGASGESVDFFADLKAKLTRRYLPNVMPGTVLDFGCGVGLSTKSLKDVLPPVQLTGFDLRRDNIDAAVRLNARHDGQINFVAGTGDTLPFPDGHFDLAFTSCVFHHIDQAAHVHWSCEIRRVLASGARLFLFEHNPYNPLTRRVVRAIPFDDGVTLLTSRYARKVLRLAGFQVERPRYYFFFPHALRWLRPVERLLRWCPLGAQYFIIGGNPTCVHADD